MRFHVVYRSRSKRRVAARVATHYFQGKYRGKKLFQSEKILGDLRVYPRVGYEGFYCSQDITTLHTNKLKQTKTNLLSKSGVQQKYKFVQYLLVTQTEFNYSVNFSNRFIHINYLNFKGISYS